MQLTDNKITEIFYLIDDFCKEFNKFIDSKSIGNAPKKKPIMSNCEIVTIMVLFHFGCFKNIKHFYSFYIKDNCKHLFPRIVSYNRFVELMQNQSLIMTLFLQKCCLGDCTGITYVYSTSVRVCNNKKIKRNKVYKGIAAVGKSTIGWFYGFKLHILLNDKGEIVNFLITQGNVDDREALKDKTFIKKIKDCLYADKGYIGQNLVEMLFVDGIKLITGIRNNMKNTLMELKDKILLRKRSVIETVNNELKNIC